MNIFDIVYTPLDTPPMPSIDIGKVMNWIDDNHSKLHQYNQILINQSITGEGTQGNNYPWKLTPVYLNNEIVSPGWLNNFNTIFPELSSHFHNAFGLSLVDLGGIVLLPTVSTHNGLGFWHQDPDKIGLRMYLEFDDFDNQLLVKKTKVKHTTQQDQTVVSFDDMLQPDIIDCKISSNTQCFFINNVNAAHTIYTNVPGKTRIAVLFTEKYSNQNALISKIESLVVNSAKKFSDYSIIW